jgi:hypothetical protein
MASPNPYFFGCRWPYVVDGLIALHKTVGLATYDGPEWSTTSDRPATFAIVGYSGDPPGSQSDGVYAQTVDVRSPMRSPHETGQVACAICSYTGDVASKTVRDQTFGALALVEAELRKDPTLGYGGGAPFIQARMGADVTLRQELHKGSECWVEYVINYETRLG